MDTCYVGDVREGLRAFIAAGIRAQTCVTSPPYWGLRDYGVPGQLGLEATPAEYVANMVEVFRLVREVLADDGTLWLNIGDSYANDAKWGGSSGGKHVEALHGNSGIGRGKRDTGLKPKDLVGIPWQLAFALQADGWYLRSDIIWAKPNPMPESVKDRPTKAHEYLFLLAKSERYYFDAEAIKEPASPDTHARLAMNGIKAPDGWATHAGGHGSFHRDGREKGATRKMERAPAMPGTTVHTGLLGHSGPYRPRAKNNESFDAAMAVMPSTRNKRSVWTIASEPYSEAHFATFPTALVEPCILAGSRLGDVVIDPFMGSGTVAQVAQSLGRHWIGCELNPEYVEMQKRRAAQLGMELFA